MRISRLSPALALLLLTIASTTVAEKASDGILPVNGREANSVNAARLNAEARNPPKGGPKGTLDAPVDGKDGKPHDGPWVETGAERDRKSQKAVGKAVKDEPGPDDEHLGPDGKPIPHSNKGVMDDPNRLGPKEGTRGTEGGVTEKSKSKITESKQSVEKTPETPKQARPLPHSEQSKIPGKKESVDTPDSKVVYDDGTKILEKPEDLPEKPHDIPLPKSPAPVSDDPLEGTGPPAGKSSTAKSTTSKSSGSSIIESPSEGKVISPIHSLFLSFTMILFSEIGDKTFLVAALMAMRHPRLLVFSAALSALITMTVLSAVLGHAVPTLIPASVTKFAAAGLFLVFGLKMLKEGRAMSPDEGVGEEMKEVEMELEEKEQEQRRMSRRRSSISPYALEAGRAGRTRSMNRLPSPPESVSSSSSREASPTRSYTVKNLFAGAGNLFSLLLSPAWVQTFVMTFLGEWGDRSQIATIAMAAGQDYWWVTMGAVVGHGICTGAAVIGGRAIAGKVSLRAVTLGGAGAFLVFGIIYFIEAIY